VSRWELGVLKGTLAGHVVVLGEQRVLWLNQWRDILFNYEARGRSNRHVVFWKQEVFGHQHSMHSLKPGAIQLANHCQMWSNNPLHTCQNDCFLNAIMNNSFAPSVYEIWLECWFHLCLQECTELNIFLSVWQEPKFLFCRCVKSEYDQTNYYSAAFHLMWKSNWMHSSKWLPNLTGKLLTQPPALNISQCAMVGFLCESLKCTDMALQEVFHLRR